MATRLRAILELPGAVGERLGISRWPGYQQIPDGSASFVAKQKIRPALFWASQAITTAPTTRRRLRELKALKGTERGPLLLIANGPSARSLTALQVKELQSHGGKIAVMNDFACSDLAQDIAPDYYFLLDPDYWTGSAPNTQAVRQYVDSQPAMRLVQPANREDFAAGSAKLYGHYISAAGLLRTPSPLRPWTHCDAVALYALVLLHYLGHSPIYITGLDCNIYLNFFVDGMNDVFIRERDLHFYSDGSSDSEGIYDSVGQPVDAEALPEPEHEMPKRTMSDMLYREALFLRDLRRLGQGVAVNVGGDSSNDALPRACLLPRPE